MPHSVLALIILAVIVFFFISRLLPLGITSVIGSVLMAVFGIMPLTRVFTAFSSDAVLLVFGTIILGNALSDTGCTKVIAKTILRIAGIGKSEKPFLIVILIAVVLLSAFLSNTATVAIFLPLVAGVAKSSGKIITRKNTFMAVGVASILGGNLTVVASTPQIVAQGILLQTEGAQAMGFFELTRGAIPLIIIMLVYYCTIGYRLQQKTFRFEEKDITDKDEDCTAAKKHRAPIAGAIFILCVAGFVTGIASVGVVAVAAGAACILTGCISFKRAAKTMDWTSVMVLGGSLGFSSGLANSGALQKLADGLTSVIGPSPFLILAALIVLTALADTFMSSTAVAAIVVPIAITAAMTVGSNPTTFAIGIVFACSVSFLSPVSTPPLTMTLAGGYQFRDYVIVGGVLTAICLAVVLIMMPILYSY